MRALICSIALLVSSIVEATAPSVDDIVARHLDARGGRAAIQAIRTLVYSGGTYREGDYVGEGTAFMAFQRPYFRVVGDPERQGFDGIMEGYDGSAWEWYADPGIVVRTVGPANGATRRGTDFDGPLVDWRAKDSRVERLPDGEVGGARVWWLRVTTRDGFARDYAIDQGSHLMVAQRTVAPIHAFGAPVATETRFHDFRRVAGVLFPFRIVETVIATGEEQNSMTWGDIVADRDLPAAWWSPPVFTRTPLQAFGEHLYFQRDDVEALRWSYAEFRRANPDLDTRRMVEVMGYQMLKMGDHAEAVALLEWNARDYPGVASAAAALGRACATAGRKAEARAAYRQALRIAPDDARIRRALADLGR